MDADGLLSKPAEEFSAIPDLAHAFSEDLAHLQGHQGREVVGTVDDHLEHRPKNLAALSGRGGGPFVLHRAGRVEGGDRVGGVSIGQRREHLVTGRVEHLEGGGRRTLLPADPQAGGYRRQQPRDI